MQTRCPSCYTWTSLPAYYPADRPSEAVCAGCGWAITVASYRHRYDRCRVCSYYYLADYGACPLCPSPDDLATTLAWQHLQLTQAPAPSLAPLSDRYCLDLWESYQQEQSGARDRVQSGPARPAAGAGARKNGAGARPAPALAPAPFAPAPVNSAHVADLLGGPVALFTLEDVAPAAGNGNGNGNGNGYGAEGPATPLRTDEGLSGVEYELIQDSVRLVEVADLLSAETTLGVDTETAGLDPYTSRLLLLQVATPQKAYIVDCQRVDPLPLKPLLESSRVLKILQNAKFDYKMLKHIAGIELCNIFDTMLAERLLTAGRAREISLAKLAMKYAGIVMDKSIRKTFIDVKGDSYLSTAQLTYAARDALIMFDIYRSQLAELKKLRMTKVAELEFQCVAAVGDMELAGVRIDTERWRAILTRVAVERDRAAEELNAIVAAVARQTTMFGVPTINLNSGPQLMETFARLGVDLPDTSEATLVKAGDHPAIKKLLEYRSHEKTLSAFGEHLLELINKQTGRLHPDFNQYGADTGRFSCTNPNVQQIPATSDFRSCFVAAEGYKLVTCDYSQAELRILAELSGDPAFVEAFSSGGDLHAITASQMFQVPLDQVTKPQRSAAKSINFGLAYGRGPGSLAVQLGVSPEDARALIEKYFQAYTGIQQWLDKAAREAVRKGYSETMLGRRRFYDVPNRDDPDYRVKIGSIERQGKNTPIQGCLAGHVRIFEQAYGYVPIATLVGQAVSVWDGERFVTAAVVASGKKQLVRVSTAGGHAIECSPDHRFLTRAGAGGDIWKTPTEFTDQDRVVVTGAVPAGAAAVAIPAMQPLAVYSRGPAQQLATLAVNEQRPAGAVRVQSVEVTCEWVEMYDVVNSETGRFMANGLIVHNSNADMTKIALVYLRSALQGYDARVVNTVHDEIVVEVIAEQAEQVKAIVEHEMVRAGEQILQRVPVVADAAIGDYWKK